MNMLKHHPETTTALSVPFELGKGSWSDGEMKVRILLGFIGWDILGFGPLCVCVCSRGSMMPDDFL